jgi:hypothetical protein
MRTYIVGIAEAIGVLLPVIYFGFLIWVATAPKPEKKPEPKELTSIDVEV